VNTRSVLTALSFATELFFSLHTDRILASSLLGPATVAFDAHAASPPRAATPSSFVFSRA
jgi:hypothetical protein